MNSLISLNEAKAYMKIADDSEDDVIQTILYAVETFMQSVISTGNKVGLTSDIPCDLKIAMLDHATFMYENRGNIDAAMPSRIIHIYKKYKTIRLF